MGLSFINLQIKEKLKNISNNVILEEYLCKQTAPEWVSVTECSDDFAWDKLCGLGREISKEKEVPVIAVRYFDDDEFAMSLFMSGKKAANFLTGSDQSCCMGVNKWAEAVGLTAEEISAFRYLTKKEMSTEICIHSLSKLFGVKLFYNSHEARAEEDLWDKDIESIIKEIKEEKRRTKSENKTGAVLLQEIPGVFYQCDTRTGILKMVYPDESGKFLYNHIHCFEIREDGLHEVHDYQYPEDIFTEGSKNLSMDYEFGSVKIMKEKTGYYVNYSLRECEEELLELMEIPTGNKKREADLPEILPVYAFSAVVQGKYEYLQAEGGSRRKELRKLELKTAGEGFQEKDIAAVYKYEKNPSFGKAYWSAYRGIPIPIQDGVVDINLQIIREHYNTLCDIRFFDQNLKIKRRVKIKTNISGAKYTYHEKTDCVYYGNLKIDLKTRKIKVGMTELGAANHLFIHQNTKGEDFLYAVCGKYIYRFDLDMNLISSHHLRGDIRYICLGKGDVRLITIDNSTCETKKPKAKSAVRLYEIFT